MQLLQEFNEQRDLVITKQSYLILLIHGAYANFERDLSFVYDDCHFGTYEKVHIIEWLKRLENSRDFGRKKQQLTKVVCNILYAMAPPLDRAKTAFRTSFFNHLENDLEDCGDRSAMLLNVIYTDWRLCTMPAEATDKQKLELMIGVAKTITLRDVIQHKLIADHNRHESVETYLYYEIMLKERLRLETAIDSMLNENLGRRNFSENNLIEMVESNYLNTLVSFPALDKFLEEHPFYGQVYSEGKDQISEQHRMQ